MLPRASGCFRDAGETHIPQTCTFMAPGLGCFMANICSRFMAQFHPPLLWPTSVVGTCSSHPSNFINASAPLPRSFRFIYQTCYRIYLEAQPHREQQQCGKHPINRSPKQCYYEFASTLCFRELPLASGMQAKSLWTKCFQNIFREASSCFRNADKIVNGQLASA